MTVTQLPSGTDILLLEADFPAVNSLLLFNYWTQPELLQQWWPQEVELEPHVGGAYYFSWPQMEWHLCGHYTAFEPGKQLGFSWHWDHDTHDTGKRVVEIFFRHLSAGGTKLLLSHGMYLDTPEDQKIRVEDHLAGWQHFLPRLQGIFIRENSSDRNRDK